MFLTDIYVLSSPFTFFVKLYSDLSFYFPFLLTLDSILSILFLEK